MVVSLYQHLSLEHSSTVERVVEELRRALFEGEIAPGAPLREVALAEALGVARSTVREALTALVAEGLADRVPHRGTVVRALDAAALADLCRARTVVETAGLRHWPDAAEEDRDALREALSDFHQVAESARTAGELTAAHLAVHRAIAGLVGCERLRHAADGWYDELRLALARVDRERDNAPEQVHSHAALLEMLEEGRTTDALVELADHLADAETAIASRL